MDRQREKLVIVIVIATMLICSACNYPGIRSIQVTDADRIARVKQDTPCFDGPGPSYKLVTNLNAGMEVVLIGVSQRADYLVMQQPDDPTEHCWGILVDFTTTDDLVAEFMKLNVDNPGDGPTPTNPMFYVEFKRALGNAVTQSGPTSTFRQRDVPRPSTSTPRVAAPISGDSLELVPTVTMDPRFGQTVHVNRDTLCWRGPGAAYEVVHALFAGQEAKAIGQDAQHDWYILDSPIYPGTDCWTGKEAITAPTDVLVWPIISIPPLPTHTPEPGSSDGSLVCFYYLPEAECKAAGGTWKGLAHNPPCVCP
jgi:hypothetical protein